MTIVRLAEKHMSKVWGRRDLPAPFRDIPEDQEPLGEIWFELPGRPDAQLLIKYLFTSEKLSIQVHPDGAAARKLGFRNGKDEAWIVLAADEAATIGLGLVRPVSRSGLRAAALDGSIERLVDWRPVRAGDILYSPAGTVHALGGGLVLVEIQQNLDLTYRLYDYGRPRELHLDEAVEAFNPSPHAAELNSQTRSNGREIIVQGNQFVLERWVAPFSSFLGASAACPLWLMPVAGCGVLNGQPLMPSSVWYADEVVSLTLNEGMVLYVAYPGSQVREALFS